jgi:hypothetical protein
MLNLRYLEAILRRVKKEAIYIHILSKKLNYPYSVKLLFQHDIKLSSLTLQTLFLCLIYNRSLWLQITASLAKELRKIDGSISR